MRTKLLTLFLALVASVGTIFAESGTFGDNLTWDLTDGVLTISGTGEMPNWIHNYDVPWNSYLVDIATITIGNSVTSIGSKAFAGCSSLTSVTIPNSVTSIGELAFADCSSLTSVTIPNSVTNIGDFAFEHCGNMTSFQVDSDNPNYCAEDGIIFNKDKTAIIAYPAGRKGAYTIPNGIESIAGGAFLGCIGLTSVTIPNSVTSIGDYAFADCYSLPIENHLRYADTYLVEAVDDVLSTYTIKDGTRWIGGHAFFRRSRLTHVTLPNSVMSVGSGAFDECSNLAAPVYNANCFAALPYSYSGAYTIPSGIKQIAGMAFWGNLGLTSVTIPNSVTSIGEDAFAYCEDLENITCEAMTPPTCKDDIFAFFADKSFPLYVPAKSINAYNADEVWKKYTIVMPIQATEVTVTEVHAEPTGYSVNLEWPKAEGAVEYDLEIKKGTTTICTLSFNEQGQLLVISFAAPRRSGNNNNKPQIAQQTATGWKYTITGLEPNAEYTCTVIAKKADDSEVYNTTISFQTPDAESSTKQVINDQRQTTNYKVIRNGQLYIQRGDEIFNAQGARVE